MLFQCPGELVECRSGRHDVINHNQRFPGQVDIAFEGISDILLALLPGQAGLRSSVFASSVPGGL